MVGRISAYVVWAALVVCSAAVCPQDTNGQSDDGRSIETARQAVRRAYEYTGFEEIAEVSDSAAEIARLEIVENDDTPFLYEYVNGRTVWKVNLDQVRLKPPRRSPEAIANQTPKNFEAWLDAETGQLLKIFSKIDGYDSTLAPEPPTESAMVQLRHTKEAFTGFVTEPPPITLTQALDNAGGTSPLAAKELLAVCVMWSHRDKAPVPVWSITGRGVKPLRIGSGKESGPMYTRNRRRAVVDARTGELLYVSNLPHVLLRPEDRRERGR